MRTPESVHESERKEVDFDVISDNWARYRLPDKTILRVRIEVGRIILHGLGDLGYPNVEIGARNIVTALVIDPSLRGPPSTEGGGITPEDIQAGTELEFEEVEPAKWQEYNVRDDRWRILVRPVVTKVVRTKKFQRGTGDPVYWAQIQLLTDIKRA